MASIQKRPSGQWRARYRDTAGKEHARHFARKVDAQRWLDEQTASTVRGDYVDPRAGRETVAEHAQRWRATLVHRPSYLRGIDNALNNHIVPAFGDRPLSTLRRSDVQGFVAALSARLAPNSVYPVYRTLSLLLAAAVDDRKIAVSPCVRIKLPVASDGRGGAADAGGVGRARRLHAGPVRGSGGPTGRDWAADQRSARAPGRRRELPQSQDAGGAAARPPHEPIRADQDEIVSAQRAARSGRRGRAGGTPRQVSGG